MALAARQHGNITRQQLIDLAVGAEAIKHRVRTGRLHRVHLGVYALGRPPQSALEHAAAAVLACGPGAALSHLSALALWGLRGRWPPRFDVTVARDRRPKAIRVHRPVGLIGRDFRRHLRIRVTSPARTLLDCAPLLDDKALARAVNDARLSNHLRLSQLADVIERSPNHPGRIRLAPLADPAGGPTRSQFEDAFPAFCAAHRLPPPLMSTKVCGYEVDALFGGEKLIVELDGWKYHSTRRAFESDRNRDADMLAAGYGTVRITWERLMGASAKEAGRLRRILELRRD